LEGDAQYVQGGGEAKHPRDFEGRENHRKKEILITRQERRSDLRGGGKGEGQPVPGKKRCPADPGKKRKRPGKKKGSRSLSPARQELPCGEKGKEDLKRRGPRQRKKGGSSLCYHLGKEKKKGAGKEKILGLGPK